MIEFFNNIWVWIVTNKDAILAFLTSSTFLTMVVSVITVIKNTKSTKSNTSSLNDFNSTISKNNNLTSDVQTIKSSSFNTETKLLECENSIAELKTSINNFENSITHKINSMFDLYSIVYSTIHDDTLREAANSVIIKAKHEGDVSKAELEKEIEALKKQISDKMEDINHTVAETVDKVKTSVIGDTPISADNTHSENVIARY